MENLMRNCFLFLSKNKTITKLAKKYGLRLGASRFVAGESVDQAVQIIKNMNKKGLVVTVDYLGEFVNSENETLNMTNQTIKTIEAIGKENLDAQVSLKLTSLGLDISEELVMTNFRRIINKAREYQVFVTIDMEDYERCEKTLEIYKTFKKEYEHLGTVIQAYLYRAEKDIKELDAYDASLRLVKGAYKESSEVAFPDKKDVDENFKKLIRLHLENGNFTAIATHDDAIIEYTKQLVKELNIPKDQYEFQMLYGIRTDRQLELIQEGYPMRVYVPYGTDWYGYYMRRLAERPANVWFVVKNMFKK
ncbi:proline dehydrogenase [Pallidibacillus thermolactis]|uniref:proline dehydrogenase n=1 Tax=Pallidibacillus thermolactis TaxID=251051 RepID=UPI0021DA4AB6|nr:proline dehydrogenase [Pallidibacillus thermolactis]MCU9601635.1 proline dehydrogenase [Pallidibacillus thermolactis subsp. kokeshiiformis]